MNGGYGVSRLAPGLATILVLSACSADQSADSGAMPANVRDSLGVTIVENDVPAREGEWWSVSSDPTLALGAGDGDSAYLFHQIRGAVRLGDGSIVVIDGTTNELRYFDEAGEHLLTTGGSGDGPGEFRHASSVVEVRADSVWVFDQFAARISVFRPDGAFDHAIPLDVLPGYRIGMLPFGSAPGGRLLIRGMTNPPAAGFGPGLMDAPIFLADPESGEVTPLASAPSVVAAADAQGRPRPIFPNSVGIPVPSANGPWTSVPARAELRRIGWDGSLELITRIEQPGAELGDDDIERILDWHRGVVGDIPAEVAPSFAEPAVLSRMPAIAMLLVDSRDHLWLQQVRDDRDPEDWEFAAPAGSTRWKVLDPDGVWLGSLDLPGGFQPHSIGDDYLLGVWTDDDGVEFIHLYGLTRD